MKIFFLMADNGGCGWYRMILPSKYLKLLGHETVSRLIHINELNHIDINEPDIDLYIIQRRWEDEIRRFIQQKKKIGKKFIFELDDNMWELPAGHKAREYWTKDKLWKMSKIISICDAVTTSSEPLVNYLTKFHEKVYCIPNYITKVRKIDTKNFNPDVVKIGFAGSDTHELDFNESIIQALLDIKEEYEHDVDMIFFGYIPPPLIGKALYYPFVSPVDYMDRLINYDFDIGIIPCNDNKFNECKSDIKFLELSAICSLTIASDVYPYRQSMRDDRGILIHKNNYVSWRDAIKDQVINFKSETLKSYFMINESHCYVKNHRLMDGNIDRIAEIYKNV